MTRVPPSRVPTRAPQPSRAAQQPSVQQRRRPQQVRPPVQKEQRLKSGNSEDSLHSEQTSEAQKVAEETGAHNMEALSHALAHAEQDQAKEAREAHAETREEAEKQEKPSGFFARVFGKQPNQKQQPQSTQQKQQPHQAKQQTGLQQALKRPNDGFEKQPLSSNSSSFTKLNAVSSTSGPQQVQNKLVGTMAKSDRPPDAFALLREAKERGVLFKEDWEREGHSEDQDDPELAAAVEEVIQRLFGKLGILRVGPGRNDSNEAVVIVVATNGFNQTSLEAIPEKAGRFATMLALSFDLLPLRRER